MTTAEFSIVREIAESHRQDSIDAYQVAREIVQRDGKATYGEATYFQQKIGWDTRRVNDVLREMNQVLREQQIAGSSADRKATSKEAATAAEILEKEGPKLASKIEELQTKLNGLEREARLSAKRCEEQTQAAQRLRELVPEYIAGQVRAEVNRIESTIGRELLDAETRVNELECCLTPSKYQDEQTYLQVLQRSFRDAVVVVPGDGFIRRALSPEWPAIRAGIQTELAELKPRIELLRIQRAEMIEAAERPLNYYAN